MLLGCRSSLASRVFYLGSGCFRSCKEEFEFCIYEGVVWECSKFVHSGTLWTVYADVLFQFRGVITY